MVCGAKVAQIPPSEEVDATLHCLPLRKRTISDQILTGEQSEPRKKMQPDMILLKKGQRRKESCDKNAAKVCPTPNRHTPWGGSVFRGGEGGERRGWPS